MSKKLTPAQDRIEREYLLKRKKHTIRDISVVELCKKAEVSHATFYKYYTDIYDLNRSIEEREFLNVLKFLNRKKYANPSEMYIYALSDFIIKYFPLYKSSESFIMLGNIKDVIEKILENKKDGEQNIVLLALNCFYVPIILIMQIITAHHLQITKTEKQTILKIWNSNIDLIIKDTYPNKSKEEIKDIIFKDNQLFQNLVENF